MNLHSSKMGKQEMYSQGLHHCSASKRDMIKSAVAESVIVVNFRQLPCFRGKQDVQRVTTKYATRHRAAATILRMIFVFQSRR
jgi:hypothetical protein